MEKLQQSARWYVYELADSRDGAVFYVGKGTGNRVDQHEKDAAAWTQVCSKKLNKIRDIWSAGGHVVKTIKAFFWDEQAAYDHETEVISAYGLETLTNVLPGGQVAWVEREQELARRKAERDSERLIERVFADPQSTLFARFADWFRFGGHHGVRVKVECRDARYRFNQMITEACYNEFFPKMMKEIISSPALRDRFAKVMLAHKVELVYGGA